MGTKVVRIGRRQYERLGAMAASNNTTMAEFINLLVDNADRLNSAVPLGTMIDDEFRRRIAEYKTLAEAESEGENHDRAE